MKKALVKNGESRIFEVVAVAFQVAAPLKFVDVADDVTPETHVYDGVAVKAKPAPSAAELQAIENERTKAALLEVDLASIRSIREWVAAQPTAPQILKDRESLAVTERAKLK